MQETPFENQPSAPPHFEDDNHIESNPTIVDLPPQEGTSNINFEQPENEQQHNNQFDFQNQKLFGPCSISLILVLSVITVLGFIFSPIYGVLCILSVLPAALILGLFIKFKRSKASSELIFEMVWSGVLSVLGVLFFELLFTIALILVAVALGIVKIQIDEQTKSLKIINYAENNVFAQLFVAFYNAFIVAAAIEESAKYFITYRIRNRREFNNPEGAVIYAVAGALGFATLENIAFVLMSTVRTEGDKWINGIIVAGARSLMAIPLHSLTAAIIGFGFANRKFFNKKLNFFTIIWIPFLIHGLYDFLLLLASYQPVLGIPSLIVDVFIVIFTLIYVIITYIKMRRNWNENQNQNTQAIERQPLNQDLQEESMELHEQNQETRMEQV